MSQTFVVDSANQTTMEELPTGRELEYLLERIQQRAYELYEERGQVDGYHDEDWARAEKEILQQFGPGRAA